MPPRWGFCHSHSRLLLPAEQCRLSTLDPRLTPGRGKRCPLSRPRGSRSSFLSPSTLDHSDEFKRVVDELVDEFNHIHPIDTQHV